VKVGLRAIDEEETVLCEAREIDQAEEAGEITRRCSVSSVEVS
jgi:hypothetical protein